MSKPSLSRKKFVELERDAVKFWLGETQHQALQRLDREERAEEASGDGLLPSHSMIARYIPDLPKGRKGRRVGSLSEAPHIEKGVEAAETYRRRRAEMREKKLTREPAEQTLEAVAKQFSLPIEYLRGVIQRGRKPHI